jgi:hypothetical protein
MTNIQLKKLAEIFAANVMFNALGTADGSKLLNEEQYEAFHLQVLHLAYKMLEQANAPIETLFIGDLDRLIEYVKK